MLNMSKQVDVFPWESSFETGIGLLDSQHRRLIDVVNRLAVARIFEPDSVALESLLEEVSRYADDHFQSESPMWFQVFGDDEWWFEYLEGQKEFVDKISGFRERVQTEGQ